MSREWILSTDWSPLPIKGLFSNTRIYRRGYGDEESAQVGNHTGITGTGIQFKNQITDSMKV